MKTNNSINNRINKFTENDVINIHTVLRIACDKYACYGITINDYDTMCTTYHSKRRFDFISNDKHHNLSIKLCLPTRTRNALAIVSYDGQIIDRITA